MHVRMFYKRFVNFVTGAKEKLQNAPEFCHLLIKFYWLLRINFLTFLLNIFKK